MKKCLALSLSDAVFIMLMNVKMPTIVGILTFTTGINFVLSWIEHGKSFMTLVPGFLQDWQVQVKSRPWDISLIIIPDHARVDFMYYLISLVLC